MGQHRAGLQVVGSCSVCSLGLTGLNGGCSVCSLGRAGLHVVGGYSVCSLGFIGLHVVGGLFSLFSWFYWATCSGGAIQSVF